MSRLRVRSGQPDPAGVVVAVTPASAGWTHVGFSLVKLAPGQVYDGFDAGRETCAVVLTGKARITAGEADFATVGGRQSVFEDVAPGAVYVPADMAFTVTAIDAIELALCTAPGGGGLPARQINAAEMSKEKRGEGSNTRFVRNILPDSAPADSLLVVEVVTPAGHWSSYPPHKHDTSAAGETALEETYYHRLNPPQGFAFQRVYTDDRSLDEAICVEDGDVVMVPRGYHPVGAAHGYDLYYLNVMAGPVRRWQFRNDPQHEWMLRKG